MAGTQADTLGQLNPPRYRGYVYHSETERYYLQSRYYDPEMGRFSNADAVTSLMVPNAVHVHRYNLAAYCWNNLIQYSEYQGGYPWPSI